MKKKMLTLMAFAILSITSVFAGGNDVNKNALAAFSASYSKATNVKWNKEENYYVASFQMNGQWLNALISEEGEMIAVSRNILPTELPLKLQATINNNYSAYWISDLVEYAVDNETKYFITVENADAKTILENVGTYDWSVMKTIAK